MQAPPFPASSLWPSSQEQPRIIPYPGLFSLFPGTIWEYAALEHSSQLSCAWQCSLEGQLHWERCFLPVSWSHFMPGQMIGKASPGSASQ